MAKFVMGRDIFREPGDLYLITVNTVGVMGAGLAKSFKEKYPDLYLRYKHDCRMRIITIGNPTIYQADDGKRFMMFPTKERWQDPSLPSYLSEGLQWIVDNIGEEDGIDPKWKIVVPPLGCNNGKLDFGMVREMIEQFSQHIPNEMVVVYPPWMEPIE
jgi:hypothetical protein